MASVVDICNRALQKLGASRIVELGEDSRNARSCNVAYEPVKLALLRKHTWSCAIKRASLAADAVGPEFGPAFAYTLPADFVRLAESDVVSNSDDFQIENGRIVTNMSAPLEIRYVANISDPNEMDALFREVLSSELAVELCEELTQSNTKKPELKDDLKDLYRVAAKVNAIERPSQQPPEDTWVTVRD